MAGDPSARPNGLERALTRAGFQLVEREPAGEAPEADAILITLKDTAQTTLADLHPRSPAALPWVVTISTGDRDAAAEALALGAADALMAPIHLPELCARLHARIRERGSHDRREPDTATPEGSDREREQNALDCRIRQEFERARRYSLSFSVILLGIDELRCIEDRSGPEAADCLRREVAAALRRELRLPDFVTTYSASEFAIILPETGQAGARQSVLRVRDRLGMVPSGRDPRLDRPRFSAGIVTFPHPAVSQMDELLPLAEAALMRGKTQAGERIGMAI